MSSNGRNVTHATESCYACRRRKKRCILGNNVHQREGIRPPCEYCSLKGLICRWGLNGDGRRTNVKTALNAEIASLKAELRCRTQERDHLIRHSNLPPDFSLSPTTALQSGEVDQLSTMFQSRLVLGPNGQIRRYGATSAFYLRRPMESPILSLKDAPPPSPSPLSTPGRTILWSRILPLDIVPLSQAEHIELLNLFFNCFAFWGLRSHRDLFRRDMDAAFSRTQKKRKLSHWSPMLHNAILAVATAYSENPRLKNMRARMAFAKKAEEYMSAEMHNPTLSGVQAMSHLATFYTGIGKWVAGASFFGMCASMTQALGLGLDASEFVRAKIITDQEKHDRDWLFLAIFLHDKLGALFLGRDILIPKPRNFRIPELTQEKPWLNDLFREQINLFSIATDMFQRVYCRSSITHNDMRVLFGATESWGENLPRSLRMPDQVASPISRDKILLHLAFHWITLLAHLPFYQSPSTAFPFIDWRDKVLTSCDLAAEEIVHLFEVYDNLRQIPLMGIQVAFAAGVVFHFQMERFTMDLPQKQVAIDKFTKCQSFLKEMARTWECAAKTQKILEDLYRKSPATSLQPCFFASAASIPFPNNQIYEYSAQYPPTLGLTAGPLPAPCIPSAGSGNNPRPIEGLIPRSDSVFGVSMGASPQNTQEIPQDSFEPLFSTGQEFYPPTFHPTPMFRPSPALHHDPMMMLPSSAFHPSTLRPSPTVSYPPLQPLPPAKPAVSYWLQNTSVVLQPEDAQADHFLPASALSGSTNSAVPAISNRIRTFRPSTNAPPMQERERGKDGWG